MVSLRERGIYLAPDGTRLIASSRRRSVANPASAHDHAARFYLYNSYAWSFHGPADFRVLDCGCLTPATADGDAPQWNADDLRDTEWTAGAH